MISDNSRQVTITIRSGVHFSPPVNREVTARDVAYGIARGFLPNVDSPSAHLYFGDVEGVAAVEAGRRTIPSGLMTPNNHTLEIRLRAPTGGLVAEALTLPLAAPVPPGYAGRFDRLPRSTYGRHQVFTGPYRIAAEPVRFAPAGRRPADHVGAQSSLGRGGGLPPGVRQPGRARAALAGGCRARTARARRPRGGDRERAGGGRTCQRPAHASSPGLPHAGWRDHFHRAEHASGPVRQP